MITLTKEMEEMIIDRAVKEIADRIWGKIENEVEEVTLLTMNRAAGLTEMTVTHLSRCMDEYVEVGEKTKRISVAQLKRLIEKRTVRKKRA